MKRGTKAQVVDPKKKPVRTQLERVVDLLRRRYRIQTKD